MQSKTYKRYCEECGKAYDAFSMKSKFCGANCRVASWRKAKEASALERIDQKNVTAANHLIPTQYSTQSSISPELQIAIDLLKKEAQRWEIAYNDELRNREDVEERLRKSQEKNLELEQSRRLDELAKAKPDLVDRILNGLGSMPAPVLEQFAPLIGRLGHLIVPSEKFESQGIEGPVDEERMQLLQRLNDLPEDIRKRMTALLGELSKHDPQKVITFMDDANQYLKTGIRIMRPHAPDFAMWGK